MAKTRLLKAYDDYYAKYIDNSVSVDKIILINGHSRGGAIANILGDYFENECLTPNIKPFVYTLASPNVTAINLTNNSNNTIFNIVNGDDIVALIPGNISGFYKYGQDVDMSIYEGDSITGEDMIDVFEHKSGYGEYKGNTPRQAKDLIESISMLIESRESAYTLSDEASQEFMSLDSFESEAAAEAGKTNIQARLNSHNLQYYAEITGVEKEELTDE